MPKKAKKGGGGKGGGRTEEERLLYLQQRAQAEEETAKKKEEILTLFLKDKLQKEERNTAVNSLKLNEGWRSILRQTRAAELREDIAVLSQTFERHLDGLDGLIKNLERDLQEAERQSAQVRRLHLQHVEQLWAQQDKRLMFVQRRWEDVLQRLGSRLDSEREQMLVTFEQQRADLEDAMFSVEQQHKAEKNETHILYSRIIASYQSTDAARTAQVVQDNKDEQLCSQETQERRPDFIQPTDAHMEKAKTLQDLVTRLRVKLNSSMTEHQSVERDLTAARDQVTRKTRELRDQLTRAQSAARKQLTDLSVRSDSAAKKLQAVIAKGESVLRVADMCHKLEGEQEDVLLQIERSPERPGPEADPPAQERFQELQHLMRSINAAALRREALRKHRDHLSQENQQLRLLLRQHLDAMTVSDDAFDGRHALLAVCPAPTTRVPPDTNRRHTVIEAVHAVKHSL